MANPPPVVPAPGSLGAKAFNWFNGIMAFLYRRTSGRIGGKMSGGDVLLLRHVGRKTGRARTAPLMYVRDGDDLVVLASRGGSDAMPAWYLNLTANPRTSVELGREKLDVVAREATEEERDRLWALALTNYPHFDAYQERTERRIPVVVLERV
jgi:deazaflavin-dependent oxidoreductase (nitroreductase family)